MESIADKKAALRKAIRRQMREMPSALRAEIDAAICRNVLELPQFQQASAIFCFIGADWEIDTRLLIDAALKAGKRVAVPLCTAPGIMEARIIQSFSQLKPGAYHIPEPIPECPVCPPEEINFAVIPCVSCDRDGLRLGQGGGFYDRYMEKSPFYTAALCREAALLERVPAEPWDRSVDCVVTEKHIYSGKA